MKKVAIVFSLALGWASFGTMGQANAAGDAAAGKEQTVVCSACHGADGNSAVGTFPKLAGLGEKYLTKQLMDIRDGARPIPTMVGQLDGKSDQDLADIAAFYDSQTRSGGQTDPAPGPGGEGVSRWCGRAQCRRLYRLPLAYGQGQRPRRLSRTGWAARGVYCRSAARLPQRL